MIIYVTVPNEHWIHKHVVSVVMGLLQDTRYHLQIDFPTHRPYENNLHHIVQDFLASNADFWLSMDADNPPMRNPLDLVGLNKDILGLPTPIWHYVGKPGERPIAWNAFDYDMTVGAYREHPDKRGLQRIDAIGTGCFLIAHRVFEPPAMRLAPFQRTYLPDGRVDRGNDFAFCERARGCGFEVWAHYDYPCRHFQEIDLAECEQAMKGLWEASGGR